MVGCEIGPAPRREREHRGGEGFAWPLTLGCGWKEESAHRPALKCPGSLGLHKTRFPGPQQACSDPPVPGRRCSGPAAPPEALRRTGNRRRPERARTAPGSGRSEPRPVPSRAPPLPSLRPSSGGVPRVPDVPPSGAPRPRPFSGPAEGAMDPERQERRFDVSRVARASFCAPARGR